MGMEILDSIKENAENKKIIVVEGGWLRHGVLWHTTEPLFYGIQEEGFHYELLEDVEKTVTDEKIRKVLKKWHDFLSPDDILERFNKKLDEVKPLSNEEKLKQWIVGKEFFNNVVLSIF